MKKKWVMFDTDEELVEKISKKYNISKILSKILLNRGISDDKEIATFLNPTRKDFYDPFLFQDMKIATDRIIKAIENNEKIMIYGDYDADGITSIIVLKKFLEERGNNPSFYIPNRLEEGYGLNKETIRNIANDKYNLLITVDCGISGLEEIKLGNELGLEIIVTDHHETLEALPEAIAVINPKRKDSKYPFRDLAGVGVVFKLIQALSTKLNIDEKEYLKYLDIVCIGTISDIVSLTDENRVITKLGLKLVEQTKNKGLQAIIKRCRFQIVDSNTISFGIAPRINACGRMGFEHEAINLFLSNNEKEIEKIADKLEEYNQERQEIEKSIFNQAIEKIKKEKLEEKNCIVLGNENWHHGVIGIVSSKITEMFFKPSLLLSFEDETAKGSGRSIPGFDLHEALTETKEYLEKFGGHSMAVGLTLKRENFEKFRNKFEEVSIEKNITDIVPIINIDEEMTIKDTNLNTFNELELLKPYGEGNRKPILIYKNVKIDSIRTLSEGRHIKITIREDGNVINCIGFNIGYLAENYVIGDKIDIVGTISENEYLGNKSIQVVIIDLRKTY